MSSKTVEMHVVFNFSDEYIAELKKVAGSDFEFDGMVEMLKKEFEEAREEFLADAPGCSVDFTIS